MINAKVVSTLVALLIPLAACDEGGSTSGTVDVLATQGNLSPEAIRLQSSNQRLISLEQQQANERSRQQSFIIQGALLGGLAGGIAGNQVCRLRDCTEEERRRATVGGGLLGAVGGGALGNAQANNQSGSAAAENALRRRIEIASRQVEEARAASAQARSVLQANQQKLRRAKQQVATGQATRAELELARADARADAQQVRAAYTFMGKSASSTSDQGGLSGSSNALKNAENQTKSTYNALINEIERAAL